MSSLNNFRPQELFSFILNNAFDSIICYTPVRDKNGEIIDFKFFYMNDSAFKTLSGKREDYIGRSFLDLFPYASQDGMFDAFKKTAETGIPSEDIFYYEYGEYKGWYRDSIIKFEDNIVVFFRDVTAQKSLELELKQQKLELEKILREKEILLKETHHRVKNNLQMISSLMNLQRNDIDVTRFAESCSNCKRRIITIATIHQILYEDQDYSWINIPNFIMEIVSSHKMLINQQKEIRFDQEIDDLNIDLNNSISIGLITSELLSNAIVHAFKGKSSGKIGIRVKKRNEDLNLIITDNGIGLPANFKIENVQTLGLTLVNNLVEQMNGTLEIINSTGTKFSIMLPKLLSASDI